MKYIIYLRDEDTCINGFFIDSFEWINMIGNDFQFFFLFFFYLRISIHTNKHSQSSLSNFDDVL